MERAGFLMLPGQQIELRVAGIFPSVPEATDETGPRLVAS